MTAARLIHVIFRRWYIVLAVLIITGLATVAAGRVEGVYSTQLDIVFVASGKSNSLQISADSLVQFAAVIERRFNGNSEAAALAGETTLYGQGVRSGWSVTLPNTGGQWQTNFNRPALSIEVVDSTPERVRAVANNLSARIRGLTLSEQVEQGVSAVNRVTTLESPATPAVTYIEGRLSRAKVGIIALGVGFALLAAVMIDRLLTRTRSPRGRFR